MFRQPEMRDGEGAVQLGDAGESVPAIPPVDINTRTANRQTVELALDDAVQFGIVHFLEHGIASLTASVLDFGGERMSEAELVSLMRSQKALQFVFLACCNGYEAACYSCLRGRPKVDRLRDVRGLESFTPRQVHDRPRQLEHAMALAPALRASASAGVRPRTQVHRPAGGRCMAAPRSCRPVSSTGQWSRTCVGPMSALVVSLAL